jgi:hypothetical protein
MSNHEYSQDPAVQEARRTINATSDFGAEAIATLITSKTPEIKESTTKLDNEYLSALYAEKVNLEELISSETPNITTITKATDRLKKHLEAAKQAATNMGVTSPQTSNN